MFAELEALREEYWDPAKRRYNRHGGELGFPNEMIRRLAGRRGGVLAVPIADRREEKGIKSSEDLAVCERFIRELTELQE
jgi:hypothetical protein